MLDAEYGQVLPREVGSGLLEAWPPFQRQPKRVHAQLLGSEEEGNEGPREERTGPWSPFSSPHSRFLFRGPSVSPGSPLTRSYAGKMEGGVPVGTAGAPGPERTARGKEEELGG